MNWFLRAKHWQLFVLTFAVPVVLEILAVVFVAIMQSPLAFIPFLLLMLIVSLGTQFGWFYTVGNALGSKLPANAGMNVRRFRSFVLVPLIYMSAILLIGLSIALFTASGGRPSPFLAVLLIVIIPLHFFSIFCILYTFWFIAKSLKMVERWNYAEVGDYIGDFFLIWFFFVGVWFIQPRINKLFDPTLPPGPAPHYPPYNPPASYPPQRPY